LSPEGGRETACGGEGGRVTPSGPFTSFIATLAACVGSGVLLGGFAAGLIDLARRGGSSDPAGPVRIGGYLGGFTALLVLLLETLIR
jgi:hypothetical protein